jgi:hypothetical protein
MLNNIYKIFVRKSEAKRPLRRPRHRWEYNIGMNLRKIGWEGVDWTILTQNRDRWWVSYEHGNGTWVP